MKRSFVIFLAVCFATLLLPLEATTEMTTAATQEQAYNAYIDNLIYKCESKAARTDSKCQNIRQATALYRLKAAYYRVNKAELVKEMLERGIGVKPHRIHYYLNKSFYDTLKQAIRSLNYKT